MASSQESEPSGDTPEEPRRRFEVSVNLLCLIGAILGVSTFLMPWIYIESGISRSDMTFLEGLLRICSASGLLIAFTVFMVGTMLTFVSPTASFLQISGLVAFYHFFDPTSIGTDYSRGLSVGYAIAISSSALVLTSYVWPIGPGCTDAGSRRRLRYRIFYLTPYEGGQEALQLCLARDYDSVEGHRSLRWLVMFVAAISIILLMLVAAYFTHEPREEMVEVDGGVMLIFGQDGAVTPYGLWDGSQLRLADGQAEVSWVLQYDSWDGGSESGWNSISLETRNLSGVLITPTVVDWTVPRALSSGDLLVLRAKSASQTYESFTEGTEYTLRWNTSLKSAMMEPYCLYRLILPLSSCYPFARGFEASFIFDDGDMSYEYHAVDSLWNPMEIRPLLCREGVMLSVAALMVVVAVSWGLPYARAVRKHRKTP